MKNIKLTLEYDGENYHGWQSQKGSGKPTIQAALEEALAKLTGETVKTVSSGRTDAGVHALGHAVNFKTTSSLPVSAWVPALNRLLPPDIRVTAAEEVPDGFHARFSAAGKTYRYLILNRPGPTALLRGRVWHITKPLRLPAMRRAAKHLVGRHDFSAFRSAHCGARTPVRTLRALTIAKRGELIEITLEADAFLMHMARNIVGTLAETGLGRFTPEDVKRALRSRERASVGVTAPACGLILVKVSYPEKTAKRVSKSSIRLKS